MGNYVKDHFGNVLSWIPESGREKEEVMSKARLIKKDDTVAQSSRNASVTKAPRSRKRREVISEWIEKQRLERKDPRKAFAALFTQPQTS